MDEPRNGRLLEYFQVRDFEAPLIRMVNLTDHVTYHLPSDTLNEETIKQFYHSYLEGKAKVTDAHVCCMIMTGVEGNDDLINVHVCLTAQDAE